MPDETTQKLLNQPADPGENIGRTQQAAKQHRRVRLYCWLHLLTGWVTAAAACWGVESIVTTFPVVIVSGIPVIVLAMRRTSWLLLCYGLSGCWGVGAVSLVIAAFDLSPRDAVPTVPLLLIVYAAILTGTFLAVRKILGEQIGLSEATQAPLTYSLRTMMWTVTVTCVLAALGKLVTWQNEMSIFASGGFALLGISAFIATWYKRRLHPAGPASDLEVDA